eukprot:m.43597 g.43597  ORF g.43597 m.43597 type:complete len:321 (+) comp10563_c0_seq3:75-1037(+)
MAAVAFVVVVVSLAPLLVGALPGNVNEDNFKQFCKTTKGFKFRPKPVKLTDLIWVHPPKTGTSFGITLIKYACYKLPYDVYPHRTEKEAAMVEYKRKVLHEKTPTLFREFLSKHVNGRWNELCDKTMKFPLRGHDPVKWPTNVVMMARDPRRRHYSGWNVHGDKGTETHPAELEEYIKQYSGCQFFMLAGIECNNRFPSTLQNQSHALQSLMMMRFGNVTVENIAKWLRNTNVIPFVGVTDEWNTSICLFHAMYGGDINAHEMENVRNSTKDSNYTQAWRSISKDSDPYDWKFFKAVKTVMIERLVRYGIEVPKSLVFDN